LIRFKLQKYKKNFKKILKFLTNTYSSSDKVHLVANTVPKRNRGINGYYYI